MNCKIENRAELVSRYLNQDMTDAEMQDFENHYFDCKACYGELKLVRTGIQVIQAEGAAVFSGGIVRDAVPWQQKFKKKLIDIFSAALPDGGMRPNYGRLSIAFALIALLAFTPFLYRDYQLGQAYGENFAAHDFLESQIAGLQHSELLAAEIFPADAENFSAPIQFQWQAEGSEPLLWRSQGDGASDNPIYEFIILNNAQEEVFRRTLTGPSYLFDEELPPGLYYWVLSAGSKPLHVGRFYFRKPVFFSP